MCFIYNTLLQKLMGPLVLKYGGTVLKVLAPVCPCHSRVFKNLYCIYLFLGIFVSFLMCNINQWRSVHNKKK